MAGIYGIRNTVNNRIYIGKTRAPYPQRWHDHRSTLRHNRHMNSELQREWVKYGEATFVFEIVEDDIPISALDEREQYWHHHFSATCDPYNIRSTLPKTTLVQVNLTGAQMEYLRSIGQGRNIGAIIRAVIDDHRGVS